MKRGLSLSVDLIAVAAPTALGIWITLDPASGGGPVWDTVLVPTVTIWAFWWRRAPLLAAIGIVGGICLSAFPTFDQIRCGYVMPGALLVLFSLGEREQSTRSLFGLAAIEAGVAFLILTDPLLDDPGAAFLFVLSGLVWGAGRLVQARTRMARDLAARTRELEQTREESAQLAVEIERAKVAADLDIAVRDRIRGIVEIARRYEGASDATSQAPFELFEREGRETLNQLRELLGILRTGDRDPSPPPTLAELKTLR